MRKTPRSIEVKPLTREYALHNAERLASIASEIPHAAWTREMIMAEEVTVDSKKVPLLGKWAHSVALQDQDTPIALAIGYEVLGKDGVERAIHLGALACDRAYKGHGLGEQLLGTFLRGALHRGYIALGPEEVAFSLQTGASLANMPVRRLYEKYGFTVDHEVDKGEGVTNVVMVAAGERVARALE